MGASVKVIVIIFKSFYLSAKVIRILKREKHRSRFYKSILFFSFHHLHHFTIFNIAQFSILSNFSILFICSILTNFSIVQFCPTFQFVQFCLARCIGLKLSILFFIFWDKRFFLRIKTFWIWSKKTPKHIWSRQSSLWDYKIVTQQDTIKRNVMRFFLTWNMTCSWHSSICCVVIVLDMFWCAQNLRLRLRRLLLKTRLAWKLNNLLRREIEFSLCTF